VLNTNNEGSKKSMVLHQSGLWLCLFALALPVTAQWRTGYFMQHEAGGQTAATIPFSKYTHVIHYALRPTYTKGVCELDATNGQLIDTNIKDFVKAAHAVGVKAIIGIVEDDSHLAIHACTTPWNVAQFAARIADFAAKNQYDGVDIAWETGVLAPQYEDLIRHLRTAMTLASLSVKVRMEQRYITAAVQDELDQINIIAYDLDSTDLSGTPITHTWYNSATLQGTNFQDNAMDVLWRDFVSAGNAANKLGVGVPFYGRLKQGCLDSYRTIGLTDPNQSWISGASNHIIFYRDLINSSYWSSGTHIWDDLRQSQYIRYQGGNCSTDAFIPYTGPEQLQAVAFQIKEASLGGIMAFGLPYEYLAAQDGDARYPLSTAIYDALAAVATTPIVSKKPLLVMRDAPSIVTTSPLPAALTGTAYSQTLKATGTTPMTWTVTGGALPSGLTLGSSIGAISGTPTALGIFTPTVTVTNAGGSNSIQLSLTVNARTGTFTYYVDSASGLDSNSGTLTRPWKTIAKVNSTKLWPGQSVAFQAGGVWREQLTVSSSGSEGNPVTFASYGSGVQPIISGADILSGFTNVNRNVWTVSSVTQPNIVMFAGTLGTRVASQSACTAAGDWYWSRGRLSIYSSGTPTGIEAGARSSGVVISNVSHVTVTGLHFTKSNHFGINMSQAITHDVTVNTVTSDYNYEDGITTNTDASNIHTGLSIQASKFAYNGSQGINFAYANNWTIIGNTLNNNGAICSEGDCAGIYGYGRAVTNGLFTNNTVYSNGGLVGTSGNGIWFDTCGSGIVLSYNIVYLNKLSGISIENTSGAFVSYNIAHSNTNNGIQLNGGTTGWILANNKVYNNTSWKNTGYGLVAYGNATASTMTNNQFKNNISLGNTAGALKAVLGGNNDGTYGRGNIYTFNALGVQAANFIQWGSGVYESTYANWETATGNCGATGCSDSMEHPPLLVNPPTSFALQSGSPAISAGVYIPGVSAANAANIGAK
jgi:hypothetical protein